MHVVAFGARLQHVSLLRLLGRSDAASFGCAAPRQLVYRVRKTGRGFETVGVRSVLCLLARRHLSISVWQFREPPMPLTVRRLSFSRPLFRFLARLHIL